MGLLVNQMRGDVSMNLSRTKRAMTGGAFALVFLFSVGIMTGTTAQAQDRDRNNRWDRNRDNRTEQRSQTVQRDRNRDGDWNRRQAAERAREIERARQLAWQREQERNRYVYTYPRTYGYGGYGNGGYRGSYGGYGGGYNNSEVQRGYYDGLNRGQEDARDRRSPNPNNSSHFRSGNAAYREGFVRGYQVGYRQYGGGRRW